MFYSGHADLYDTANEEMLRSFQERCTPQGEIGFLPLTPHNRQWYRNVAAACVRAKRAGETDLPLYRFGLYIPVLRVLGILPVGDAEERAGPEWQKAAALLLLVSQAVAGRSHINRQILIGMSPDIQRDRAEHHSSARSLCMRNTVSRYEVLWGTGESVSGVVLFHQLLNGR